MDKKTLKKMPVHDMEYFLTEYYGIDNKELVEKLSELSHKDLKYIASLYDINLVRTSFDYISKEQIATGTVLLVNDYYNHTAPYVNPNRTLNDEFNTELSEEYCIIKEEIDFNKNKVKRKIKIRRNRK